MIKIEKTHYAERHTAVWPGIYKLLSSMENQPPSKSVRVHFSITRIADFRPNVLWVFEGNIFPLRGNSWNMQGLINTRGILEQKTAPSFPL